MEDFISTLKISMTFLDRGRHSQVFILEGRVRLGLLERIVVKMMGLEVYLNLLLQGRLLPLRRHLHFRGLCISRWYVVSVLWALFLLIRIILLLGICGTSDLERSW